ncbi:tRNA(Glu)-specific nuclease WapA [Anoxybacillus sp. P3H1B]|uniref:RHS repeat-associated core domain-containing protein n=1 Tax=Anoxybacillus sp. P3H1B TaxID=1769293 RepID=UPI000797023B|nr:RHS repeat-associated core domain-containing protein [Anoxybacillus sp. P3H1B]KXG10255.1 tRNA(Glu)-specific nuclease WapA [Anoxybacillus sp. P3H1B]
MGDTFYYVTNYHGDVVRMVDGNGATVANYSYDPWGKVLSVSENAAVAGQLLGYAGYYYDRETKLYYLQARYYDPETARFLSRDRDPGDKDDPITQNAYTYTNDNPVMLVDPDGNRGLTTLYRTVAGALTYVMVSGAVAKSLVKKAVGKVAKKVLRKGTGNLNSLLKKKSLGRGSTGRTTPNSLEEQLAMKEVLSNPLAGAREVVPRSKMNDKRWLGSEGWVKMQRIIKTSKGNINIHFNYNIKTGKFDDFKFK